MTDSIPNSQGLLRKKPFPLPNSLRRLAPYAALFALFFYPVAMGHLFSGGDIVNQYLPWKDFWRRAVWSGQWPLWNPLSFCGMPFQADPQVGQFYPPNWLFLILPAAPCYTLVVLLHFAFGAWGMWRLAARLVDSGGARFVAVAVFLFSGYFITRFEPGVVMFAISGAWLPWILDATVAWTRDTRPRDALLIAAGLAMQLFSGAPQVFFYTVLAVALWAPFGVCARTKASRASGGFCNRRQRVGKGYLATVSIGLLAAMMFFLPLALVQLWPTWEFVQASFARAGGATLKFIADGSMTARMMLIQFVPFFFFEPMQETTYWGSLSGYHELSAYAGWTAYTLACLGFFAGGRWAAWRERDEPWPLRRAMVYYCMTLAVLATLLSFGPNLPLLSFVYRHVPGFNLFRDPARIQLLGVLTLALLAAAGWEIVLAGDLLPRRVRLRARRALTVFAAVSLIGLVCALGLWEPLMRHLGVLKVYRDGSFENPDPVFTQVILQARLSVSYAFGWAAAAVAAAAFFIFGSEASGVGWKRAVSMAATLGVFLVADLWWFGARFVETKPAWRFEAEVYPKSKTIDLLQQRAKDGGRFIYTDDVFGFLFDQNQPEITCERPMVRDLAQLRGYNPMLPRPYVEFTNLWRGAADPIADNPGAFLKIERIANTRLLDVWNARTILSYQPLAAPGLNLIETIHFKPSQEFPGAERIPQDLHVYDNSNALGEAWLCAAVDALAAPTSRVLSVLAADGFDFRALATVDSPPVPPTQRYARGERVEVVSRGVNHLRLRVECAANRVLVVPISWYKGWRARINGLPEPLLRVNHAMMGVAMPGGPAEVELRFLPSSFLWGGLIGAVAWFGWLWMFIRARRRRYPL